MGGILARGILMQRSSHQVCYMPPTSRADDVTHRIRSHARRRASASSVRRPGPASTKAEFYGLDWIATVPPTVRLTTERFGREKANVVFG